MDILSVGCHRVGNAEVLDSCIPDVPVAVSSKSNCPIWGQVCGEILAMVDSINILSDCHGVGNWFIYLRRRGSYLTPWLIL